MKIRYMSDLHTEFWSDRPDPIPSIGEDLVVLAGDIGIGAAGIEWAKQAFAGRQVAYVSGNHEFYRGSIMRTQAEMHDAARGSNIHLLDCDSVRVNGLEVMGCTLWTDFRSMESNGIPQEQAMEVCNRRMNDYRLIENDIIDLPLTPDDVLNFHESHVNWLRERLAAADGKVLVVTHHAPIVQEDNPRFSLDAMSAGYYTDLSHLMNPARVHAWIFGHTHYPRNGVEAEKGVPMPVVSNPRGYPHDGLDFNWDRCLEIEV